MSVVREMIAAGPGCALANGMLNGLETTKVKMQLHNHSSPVYHNLTTRGVMQQIIREEGIVNGLLKPGLSASLARSMLYGAYRVGLYSTARDYLASSGEAPRLSHRIFSGMFTGGLGAMLTCPLDVIRTRMQADAGVIKRGVYQTGLRKGFAVRYGTLSSTFLAILREEGLRSGLYRGASVTIARASLLNGAQLASYDSLKHVVEMPEGPLLHIMCAFSSGVIAQTVVMPIDTIKSSLMIGKCRTGIVEAVMKNGGAKWFYRGYLPACAGQGLIMVLQMPLIEQFRKMLGAQPI
ncbi:MAG: hypothetical protein SGBAC_008144 [Bacillariaceae sp.]